MQHGLQAARRRRPQFYPPRTLVTSTRRRDHRAAIRAEADQEGVPSISLAGALTWSGGCRVGRAGVAGVTTVRPDDRLCCELEHTVRRDDPDLVLVARELVVEVAQPAEEVQHLGVSPQPAWERRQSGERVRGQRLLRVAARKAVDRSNGGTYVGRQGNHGDAAVLDKAPGQLCPRAEELVRAQRLGSQDHEPRLADELEEWVVVAGFAVGKR